MDSPIRIATYLLTLSLGLVLLYCASLAAPYPYTDDWIYASAPSIKSANDFIYWIFSQHVDHRIPFQKASQLLLLRLSGFDFRWLIALNITLALGTCAVFVELCRVCRGHRSWMDLCVPLIVLNPALPPYLWGFQMQFVIPTLAVGVSMLLMVTRTHQKDFSHVAFANLAAVVAAFSGMNGVIAASISVIAIALMVWRDRNAIPLKKSVVAAVLGSLVLITVLWLTWTPSTRTNSSLVSVSSLLTAMQALTSAGLASWLYASPSWKMAFNACILLLGTAAIVWQFYLSPKNWLPLCVVAAQSFSLLLAAALGRSGPEEWTWMHALHYGFIAAGLSVSALAAISASGGLRALALPIIVFVGYANYFNGAWRVRTMHETHEHIKSTFEALNTEYDVQRLAREYTLDFWWIKNDPKGIATVSDGIRSIRKLGYWLPKPLDRVKTFIEPNDPMIINQYCNVETLQVERLGELKVLRVSGWLLREDRQALSTTPAWLTLRDRASNQRWKLPLDLSKVRSDLAPGQISAGFQSVADITDLPDSPLPVTLDYYNNGHRVICDNGRATESISR